MEQREIVEKTLKAAKDREDSGDYWSFLEMWTSDYYHSDRIAEICDLEKKLDERLATMPEDDFNSAREELHRLTLKCLDEALCNYINNKYPGATKICPKL